MNLNLSLKKKKKEWLNPTLYQTFKILKFWEATDKKFGISLQK